jgi:Golgi phosphoprotein 3 GPP34
MLRAESTADRLYLMAHDDRTGNAKIPGRVLGLGLGAALLADLVLDQRITVRNGSVAVLHQSRPPHDQLAARLLDFLYAEAPRHTLGTWLAFFARDATTSVAQRLVRAGFLREVVTRRMFTTRISYEPVNLAVSALPAIGIRNLVVEGRRLSVDDVTLLGLIDAARLRPEVLWDVSGRTFQYLEQCVKRLPGPLLELIAETETAVHEAVMSHRT